MILFTFDQDNDRILLEFSSEHFHEMVELCHLNELKFLKEERKWTGNNSSIYNLLKNLDFQQYPYSIDESLIEKVQPKKKEIFKRKQFLPELFKSDPLGDYQIEDTKKMINSSGIINGSDVGLGKTLESITALNHLFYRNEIDKVFIVTFAQACYNWKRELLKFSTFIKSPEEICLPNLLSRDPFINNPKVIICSYNMFVLIEKFFYNEKRGNSKKKLTKHSRTPYIPFSSWGNSRAIVLDESHSIKNRDAFRTKSIMKHKDFFSFKYLLSATPYPNGVEELYCLLKFIDENIIYAPYGVFVRRIAYVGTKYDPNAIQVDYKTKKKRYKIEELNKFLQDINPYIFRRFGEKKTQQYIKKIYVEMNKEQKSIYQKIISEKLESIKEEKGFIQVRDVVNSFPYLTLSCSDPSILKNKLHSKEQNHSESIQQDLENWNFNQNSKLDACSGILEECSGEKVIIWSSHPITIELLGEYYKKYNPIIIHGTSHESSKLSKEEYRDNLLIEFKTSKKRNIIIMNPSIMGTSLNIEESSICIFFDRNYDVKEYLQALGRNHRGTSEKDVIAYVLINDNTLENRQDYILENKIDLNKYLFEYNTLTMGIWKKIFSGEIENAT